MSTGHSHDQDHDHSGHEHGSHGHDHEHHLHDDGHGHELSRWSRFKHRVVHMVTPHSHDAGDKVDSAMQASREGMRTLWISFAVLGVTAALQAVVVALSGSVALLGDTIHNAADALTAVPLGVAFVLGRRPPNRRYTYGYGRAEDLAGVAIVLTITASSALAAATAIDRLLHPRDVQSLLVVSFAAIIGFAGNEGVARYRILTGRRIGSAALVADGLHARTDGFTSLAVLLGAAGSALGWRWADPVIGLVITAAILAVVRDAARQIYRRLMDAVDPAVVDLAHSALAAVPGVRAVGHVRMRWIGHALRAEAEIVVDADLTVIDAHALAVEAEHALIHAIPRLTAATVHTDYALAPHSPDAPTPDPHELLAHPAGH